MKRIFLVAILGFSILSCGKKSDENQTIDSILTNKQSQPQKQKEQKIEDPASQKYHYAVFFSSPLNQKVETKFFIFTNENHPNGYVIISKIVYGTNVLSTDDNPERYIESINTKFMINGKDIRKEPEYLEMFRTAEAAVIAYYENESISNVAEVSVFSASLRMHGNKFGSPSIVILK